MVPGGQDDKLSIGATLAGKTGQNTELPSLDRQVSALTRAFRKIADAKIRQTTLDLVRAVARDPEEQRD